MRKAATDPECPDWHELAVVLVDDEQIRHVKQEYFGRGEVTDVVSVSYDPVPGDPDGCDADIVVNVQQADREGAARAGADWSRDHELALYIAHGCDHLCGGRDDDKAGHDAMRRRELTWLWDLFPEGSVRLFENEGVDPGEDTA